MVDLVIVTDAGLDGVEGNGDDGDNDLYCDRKEN
jgi:hypothetical protein